MKIKTRICSVILLILVLVLTLGFSSCKPTVKPDPDDPIVPPDDPVIPIIETDTLNITESGSYTINSKYVQINISAPNVTLTSGNVPFINITSGSVTLNSVTSARVVLKDNVHLIINENSNVTKVEVDGNNSSIELSHNLEELLVVESASNTSVKLNEANIGLVGLASKATFTGNGQILTVVTDNFSYYDSKLPVDYIAYQTPPYVSSGGSRNINGREKPVVQTYTPEVHTHNYVLDAETGYISCSGCTDTITTPYIAFLGENNELLTQNIYLLSGSLPSGVTYNSSTNSLTYTNTGAARNVVIRTNGGTLTIDAASDKVYHYGNADALDIIAVAPTSYHENGTVGYAKIATGRLVVEETAIIDGIYLVANSSGEFDGIKLAVVGDAKLPELARADVELAAGQSKLVVEVQTLQTSEGTDANPEYVWISNTGTIESPVVNATISSSKTDSTQTVASPTTVAAAVKEDSRESATPITDNSEARIGAVGYATLKEAFDASHDGDTVTILKDITVDVSNSGDFGLYNAGSTYYGIFYYLEKACNIDGGNHTITTTGATKLPNNKINTGFIYYDYRAQSVSIKDLNLVSEGFNYAITYGGVEDGSMDNCHITADNCCVTISAFSASDPRGGVLTINNSEFYFVKGELTRSDYAPSAAPIASQYGSDIIIKNSSISATDGGALYVWPSGGSITANNCDLICSEAVAYSWIGNGANTKADSIISINNSTITGSSSYIVQTGTNSGQHHTASIYVDGELKATVTE